MGTTCDDYIVVWKRRGRRRGPAEGIEVEERERREGLEPQSNDSVLGLKKQQQ